MLEARLATFVLLTSGIATGTGTFVLLGWCGDWPILKSIVPGLVPMQPNTALGLILVGLALAGLGGGGTGLGRRPIGLALAGAVALLGLLTVAEHVAGVDLALDRLLFGLIPEGHRPVVPNRMAPATAVGLGCLGASLLLMPLRGRVGRGTSQGLALFVVVLTLPDLIGYTFGFDFLVGPNASMAVHTATSLFVLGLGIVAAQPETGLMRRFVADDAGGWLLRNFLPLALFVPLLLSGARILGEGYGLFNNRVGLAILVLGNIVTLVGLVWWTAGRLSRADGERSRAEAGMEARERWLRITLTSIGDAVIATDDRGAVTFLNPVAEALIGWSQPDAAGQPLADVFRIVNEATRRPVANPAQRALHEGITVGLANHTILIARNGTERPIEDSAAPIRLDDGTITGAVLVFRDASERRRAELALAQSRDRLRMALIAARMVSFDWTVADESLRVSENAAEVFGLPLGSTLLTLDQGLSLIHPADVPNYQRAYEGAIAELTGYLIEYRLVRPDDGRVLWMEERGQVVAAPEGKRLTGVVMDITERKKADEDLQLALIRLDAILTASEIGTWEFDVAADVFRGDRNFAAMFGVSSQVASGAPVAKFIEAIHPDDRARAAVAFDRALATGADYEAEYRLPGIGDGGRRVVVARGRVRRDASGRVIGLPGVVVDITRQKQVEEELREARSRLESTLSAGEIGTWEYEVARNVVRADANLARMFGIGPDEAAGGSLGAYTRAIHPDDRERVAAAIGRALRTEAGYEEEYRIVGPDGGIRWVVARGRVERDDLHRGIRLPGVVVDITRWKQAEEQLRVSEARFRTLFDSMDEGFCVVEMIFDAAGHPVDYRFLEMNPAFERHSGLRDVLGSTIREIAPDHEPFWFETYGRVALSGEPTRFVHEAHALGDRWFDVYAFRLGGEGSPKVAILFNDISTRRRHELERSRLEDDLRKLAADLSEADRRKDEFLATLAHELRNPLAPIRNALQIMHLAGDDRQTIDESRALMERQVTHMVRLIDDLMDVSRITRNKLELRRERIELAAVVQMAVEASRPLVQAAAHDLTVSLPERPIFVDADVTRLAQVFANLLNNAAKYTERGGKIVVTAARTGGEVVVTVRDDGVGIPAEMLPDIFTMFTQVDRSLERSQGGLGIGLSLVKTLVAMHGGSVEVRSEGHGLGSEFAVRLPVVVAAASRRDDPAAADDRSTAPTPRTRILIVDDNRDSARTLARLLKLLGHETRTAYDGGEAVEVAEAYRPEVMLLDIGMPVLNGFEVARAIRNRPWGGDVRIVALTGWGQEGDRKRSAEAGFDHHLVKPVDPSDLENLLDRWQPTPGAAPLPAES